jgi:predicted O-methyltransferase YrrM
MLPAPHFKHADTRLLIGFGLAYAAAAIALWLPLGLVSLPILVGLALLLLAGLALHLHRERQTEASHALNHVQALIDLHTLLTPRAPLPRFSGWAASAELASTIVGLILERKPQRVVELGSGASSIVVGYALERVGHGCVLSFDHDREYAAKTRRHIERHDLTDRVEVQHAPLVRQQIDGRQRPWYALADIETALDAFAGDHGIDLLIVDGPPRESDPEARYPALPALADRLADGAVVVLDDALRDEEQHALDRWKAEIPGIDVEIIPSAKGVAVVRLQSTTVTARTGGLA